MSLAKGGDVTKRIDGLMRALDASIRAAVEHDRRYADACATGDFDGLLEIVNFHTPRADHDEPGDRSAAIPVEPDALDMERSVSPFLGAPGCAGGYTTDESASSYARTPASLEAPESAHMSWLSSVQPTGTLPSVAAPAGWITNVIAEVGNTSRVISCGGEPMGSAPGAGSPLATHTRAEELDSDFFSSGPDVSSARDSLDIPAALGAGLNGVFSPPLPPPPPPPPPLFESEMGPETGCSYVIADLAINKIASLCDDKQQEMNFDAWEQGGPESIAKFLSLLRGRNDVTALGGWTQEDTDLWKKFGFVSSDLLKSPPGHVTLESGPMGPRQILWRKIEDSDLPGPARMMLKFRSACTHFPWDKASGPPRAMPNAPERGSLRKSFDGEGFSSSMGPTIVYYRWKAAPGSAMSGKRKGVVGAGRQADGSGPKRSRWDHPPPGSQGDGGNEYHDAGGGGAWTGHDHAVLHSMVEEYLFDLLGVDELSNFFTAYAAAVAAEDADVGSAPRVAQVMEELLRLCEQRCVASTGVEEKFGKLRATLQISVEARSSSLFAKGDQVPPAVETLSPTTKPEGIVAPKKQTTKNAFRDQENVDPNKDELPVAVAIAVAAEEEPQIIYASGLGGRQSYTARLLLLLGVSLAVLIFAVVGNHSLQARFVMPPLAAYDADVRTAVSIPPYVEAASAELGSVVAGIAADLAFLSDDPFAHSDSYISDTLERSQDGFVVTTIDRLDISVEAKEQLMPNVTARFALLREQLDRALNASRVQRDEREERAKRSALRMMREQCTKFEPDGKPSSVDVHLVGELRRIISSFSATAASSLPDPVSGAVRPAAPSPKFAARLQELQTSADKLLDLAHAWNLEEYQHKLAVPKVENLRIIANPPFRSCDNGKHNLTFELSKIRPEYFAADTIAYVQHAQLIFSGSGGGSGRLQLGYSDQEHVVSSGGGTKSRHVHNTVYYRPRTATVRVHLQRYGWSAEQNCSHPLIMDSMNITVAHTLHSRHAPPYERPRIAPAFGIHTVG